MQFCIEILVMSSFVLSYILLWELFNNTDVIFYVNSFYKTNKVTQTICYTHLAPSIWNPKLLGANSTEILTKFQLSFR